MLLFLMGRRTRRLLIILERKFGCADVFEGMKLIFFVGGVRMLLHIGSFLRVGGAGAL